MNEVVTLTTGAPSLNPATNPMIPPVMAKTYKAHSGDQSKQTAMKSRRRIPEKAPPIIPSNPTASQMFFFTTTPAMIPRRIENDKLVQNPAVASVHPNEVNKRKRNPIPKRAQATDETHGKSLRPIRPMKGPTITKTIPIAHGLSSNQFKVASAETVGHP